MNIADQSPLKGRLDIVNQGDESALTSFQFPKDGLGVDKEAMLSGGSSCLEKLSPKASCSIHFQYIHDGRRLPYLGIVTIGSIDASGMKRSFVYVVRIEEEG